MIQTGRKRFGPDRAKRGPSVIPDAVQHELLRSKAGIPATRQGGPGSAQRHFMPRRARDDNVCDGDSIRDYPALGSGGTEESADAPHHFLVRVRLDLFLSQRHARRIISCCGAHGMTKWAMAIPSGIILH